MKRHVASAALIGLLLLPAAAFAQPQVIVNITAEKEVTAVKNGQKTTKRVAAKEIESGQVVYYTVHFENKGTEAATNAIVDDPIPSGVVYLPGSVSSQGADVTFSIDGGKSFKKPSMLSYEVTMPDGTVAKHVASPEEYTHIRWTIRTIPPGGHGSVGFQAKVK